ncbi:cell division protein FtsQ/DivIB [Serinibacter salmoneus]|uniref:Cell division protein FtsQ n=1 Tax=Serinibacter salmoneus TaxID=556530 RepID=A0A2A9D0M3_9MICO|nr:cell division protein FtsQ/DivIB [Serinibacter salmoneus]PFG19389.1 cell division protein FtsQ [Serinibacter salmoneus]
MKRPNAPRAGRSTQHPSDGSDLVLSETDLDATLAADVPSSTSGASGSSPSAAGAYQAPVSSLHRRLSERQRASRRRWAVRASVGLTAAVLVGLLVWTVMFSSLLALRADAVAVRGEGAWVDATEVADAVGEWVGTPLARLDSATVLEPVLALPGVQDATMSRAWPHGVSVTIEPREPVARVTGADTVDLLGDDGVVIATVPAAQSPGGLAELAIDMSAEDAAQTAVGVLEVLAALPDSLGARVESASATSPRSITLVLDDGAQVLWGDGSEPELKAAVLETLLQVGAQEYDVSAPLAPTTS